MFCIHCAADLGSGRASDLQYCFKCGKYLHIPFEIGSVATSSGKEIQRNKLNYDDFMKERSSHHKENKGNKENKETRSAADVIKIFCMHCAADLGSGRAGELQYCFKCGNSLHIPVEKDGGSTIVATESFQRKPLSYDDFMAAKKTKTKDRSSHFKGTKRKASEVKDVKIQVGLMRNGKPKNGSRIVIITPADSTAETIITRACEKMRKHDARFPEVKYSLRYPDGRSVTTLLESNQIFNLMGYKNELMKDFSKVCLFLQPEVVDSAPDAAASSTESSDSDFEVETFNRTSTFVGLGTPSNAVGIRSDRSPTFVISSDEETATFEFQRAITQSLEFNKNITGGNIDQLEALSATSSSTGRDDLQPSCSRDDILLRGAYLNDENLQAELKLTVSSEESFINLLKLMELQIEKGLRNNVNACRQDVLGAAIRSFQRNTFDSTRSLNVRFVGEDSQDTGGPMREFLRLVLQEIKKMGIFEGPEDAKRIVLDYSALSKGLYRTVGKICAYSIVHRGPLPAFFSPLFYQILSDGYSIQPESTDILDRDLRDHLRKISEAETNDQYETAVKPVFELIEAAGCLSMVNNVQHKKSLVEAITHFLIIARNVMAINQFKEGLGALEVLNYVQSHAEAMREAFVSVKKALDASAVESVFEVEWSERGSNRYLREMKTFAFFRDFLQNLEDAEELQLVLVFTTGMAEIPTLGFFPAPTITFGHPEDLVDNPTAPFPVASTCSNSIRLPVLSSWETFEANMLNAVSMATTFTLA